MSYPRSRTAILARTVLCAVFILFGVMWFGPTPTHASTSVSGVISSNTTWTSAGSPYVVTGDVQVLSDVTLTVDSGVTVKFQNSSKSLLIYGTLDVNGTSGSPVYFTSYKDDAADGDDTNGDGSASSPAAGDWWKIEALSGGAVDMEYTVVRYGGYHATVSNRHMLYNSGGTLSIDTGTVSDSYRYGSYQSGGTSTYDSVVFDESDYGHYQTGGTSSFSDVEISDADYGVYVYSGTATVDESEVYDCSTGIYNNSNVGSPTLIVTDSDIHDNSYGISSGGYLTVTGNTFTDHTTAAVQPRNLYGLTASGNTLSGDGMGYWFMGRTNGNITMPTDMSTMIYDLAVGNATTVTVPAGAIIKLWSTFSYIKVESGGTLDVNGTSGSPVYFTSYKDDSVGGDANGDGSSSGTAGDWFRIEAQTGGTIDMDYATLRYGGYNSTVSYRHMLYNSGGSMTIDTGTVSDSYRYGSYQTGGTTSFTSVTFDNSLYGHHQTAGTATFTYVDIDASSYGVYTSGGSVTVDESDVHDASTGIYASGSSTNMTVTDSDISDNSYGILGGANFTITGNTFTDHTTAAVAPNGVHGLTASGNTLSGTGMGYWFNGYINGDLTMPTDMSTVVYGAVVASPATLTVGAGSVVKFWNTESYLKVNSGGTLDVNGSSSSPAYFTSFKDDEAGVMIMMMGIQLVPQRVTGGK
ncbi:MAG: right-handed parallel beta-helix repeat-containing protein [Patescibacteria group bacterium]|nr:right-handed parallel beta-helix repeat-containing protein [Patescibacteria group bacterium]